MANRKKRKKSPAGRTNYPAVPVSIEQKAQRGMTIRKIEMSGPLPDPMSFAAYDQTTPGAGERILAMAEKEQAHRHSTESLLIRTQTEDMRKEHWDVRLSHVCALIAVLALLGVSTLLVCTDYPVYGSLLSGATVVGVITAFVQGKRQASQGDLSLKPQSRHK